MGRRPERGALLALALICPAPTLGVLAGLVVREGPLGTLLWAAMKAWLLLVPLAFLRWVDREPISLSPPRNGGLAAGAVSGIAIAAAITAAWLLAGDRLVDPEGLHRVVEPTGLLAPRAYLGAAVFWIAVNSVLEEYVYRWFVYSRFRRLVGSGTAVVLAAVVFALHHVVALGAFFGWRMALIGGTAVLAGGIVWSGLYGRYGSVWVPWMSHAIVDVAVFGIGALLLFG